MTTEIGDKVRYDVVNLIPPQRAGAIAVQAELVGADKRWCEVNHVTYESVKQQERPRDRRRDHRPAGAEVRQHRQRHGQDLRDRDRPSAQRQGAARSSPPATPATAGSTTGRPSPSSTPTGSTTARSCRSSRSSRPARAGRRAELHRRGAPASGTTCSAKAEATMRTLFGCSAASVAAPRRRRSGGPAGRPGRRRRSCAAPATARRQSRGDTASHPGRASTHATSRRRSRTTRPAAACRPRWSPTPRWCPVRGRRHRRLLRAARPDADRRGPRGRAARARGGRILCHLPWRRREGDRAKLIPDLTGQPPGLPAEPAPALQAGPAEPRGRRAQGGEARDPDAPRETLADLAAYFSSLR